MGKSRLSIHTSERGNRYYGVLERAGQQYINATGIECIYISTSSGNENGRDPIYLEERDEIASFFYDDVKISTNDGVPIMSNESTKYDYLSWLSTGTYWVSKKDFKELTMEANKFNSINTGYYTPMPGDIIIMKMDKYFPIFELTGIDDDGHHNIDQRMFWEFKLQTVTNRMIDFSNIRPQLDNIIRDFMYDGTNEGISTPYKIDPEIEKNIDNVLDALDQIIKPSKDWSESIDTTLSINDKVEDDERNINEPNEGDEQLNYPFGVY